jgi:hypothetical protein
LLIAANCPAIVFQGFPLTFINLIKELKQLSPDFKIYDIWHGGFIQSDEDYNWRGFQIVEQLCQEGTIQKWGFVKKGIAEIMATLGLQTGFVMNYVNDIPEKASEPMDGGPHIGIWSSWRKTPFVALAASSIIPSAKLDLFGYSNDRLFEYVRLMKIPVNIHTESVPQHQMQNRLRKYHLNLYMSFYECTPMLPLESLSVGVPCLLGPNSHLFDDHDYLHSRLIVPYPDRAEIIASYIKQALEERIQIIQAYREYAPGYNAAARLKLKDFLDGLEA